MKKFSIVTYIKNGKTEASAFTGDEFGGAIKLFEKLRSEGVEAYLFHRPLPRKHCKSAEARKATRLATSGKPDIKPSIIEKIASKVGRKSKGAVKDGSASVSDAVDLG